MIWTRELIIKELRSILISADPRKKELVEKCTEDSSLAVDLGLTSIGILYIVIAVEETFNIRFDGVNASDFGTLRDVVNYIEEKLK